jgi:hypothetical protein
MRQLMHTKFRWGNSLESSYLKDKEVEEQYKGAS